MTSDNRMTWGLIIDVLDLLERHGYHKHDDQHTGQAIGVIHDLARVYEGDHDAPYGTYPGQAPSPSTSPGPPGPEPGTVRPRSMTWTPSRSPTPRSEPS